MTNTVNESGAPVLGPFKGELLGTCTPLVPVSCVYPMEELHINQNTVELQGSEKPKNKTKQNLLMVMDHFTHHTLTFLLPNLSARAATTRVQLQRYGPGAAGG